MLLTHFLGPTDVVVSILRNLMQLSFKMTFARHPLMKLYCVTAMCLFTSLIKLRKTVYYKQYVIPVNSNQSRSLEPAV